MAEEVVISSMRDASEVAEDAKVADVKSLFDTHVKCTSTFSLEMLISIYYLQ